MGVLKGVLMPFQLWNDVVLKVGRWIAIVAIALMVVAILVQVFFRYVLSNPLPWPEELARFMMLWMTGLIAPLAYRRGGFVAIDMLERALPRLLALLLALVLMALTFWVLIILWDKGLNNHVNGISGRGCSASLRWPFDIEFGKCGNKFQNRFQYLGLWVGVNLLILVNIELILRTIIKMLGGGAKLTPFTPDEEIAGAS